MENIDEISKETKIAILKQQIASVNNTLYNLEIQARVANKVSDEASKKRIMDEMAKFEQVKDEYKLILEELNKLE